MRVVTTLQPIILYNGGAALNYNTAPGPGTTGTVTLSEDVSGFKRLFVTYRAEGEAVSPGNPVVTRVVPCLVGSYVGLDVIRYVYDNKAGKEVCQFAAASYLVGGRTLSYAKRIYGNLYSGSNAGTYCGTDSGQACIMRVEGVR